LPQVLEPKPASSSRFSVPSEASGLERRNNEVKYTVIIEKAEGNYSAYVPDLPGCVSVGDTVEETERNIREAIVFHIRGLRDEGLDVPEPTSIAAHVEVPAH